MHAYGITPNDDQVRAAVNQTKKAYRGLPDTTCNHRACCCKAGCPNMYYSEYLAIRFHYIDKMSHDDRFDLLIKCIWYYLLGQDEEIDGKKIPIQKPCPHLGEDNMCKVYDARPLKCRTYGLVPADMHRRITHEVSEESGIAKEDIPLCIQCPFVKVNPEWRKKYPDNVIPEEFIANAESHLRGLDRALGFSKKIQDDGFGFLTFHDWHIMSVLGETWMAQLTPLRKEKSREWKEAFLNDLKDAFRVSYPDM